MKANLIEAARVACAAIGVEYRHVPTDGAFHTLDIANDPKGKADGRIKLFPDGQGGLVWNHKTGEHRTFFVGHEPGKPRPPIDTAKLEAEKAAQAKAKQAKHAAAAKKARYIWDKSLPADPSHPYLAKKGIKPHGARKAWHGALIIPGYDAKNRLVTLQYIRLGKKKIFLTGSQAKGCYWWMGKLTHTILVAEGFATAATVFELTGYLTVIAYGKDNLESVARIIRHRQPQAKIIICADNDESGVGQKYANAAAAAVNGYVAMPPTPGQDFNDWAAQLGGKNG